MCLPYTTLKSTAYFAEEVESATKFGVESIFASLNMFEAAKPLNKQSYSEKTDYRARKALLSGSRFCLRAFWNSGALQKTYETELTDFQGPNGRSIHSFASQNIVQIFTTYSTEFLFRRTSIQVGKKYSCEWKSFLIALMIFCKKYYI